MKKLWLIAAVAVTSLFALSSCNKDDDEKGEGVSASIEGTWEGVTMEVTYLDKNGKVANLESVFREMLEMEGYSGSDIDDYIAMMREEGMLNGSLTEDFSDTRLEFKSGGTLVSYYKNDKTGAWEKDEESTWSLKGETLTVTIDRKSGEMKVKTLNKSKLVLELSSEVIIDMMDGEEFAMFEEFGLTVKGTLEFKRI